MRTTPRLGFATWILAIFVGVTSLSVNLAAPVQYTTTYDSPFYGLQELALLPSITSSATITRFGCGLAVTPDKTTAVVLGVDSATMRQVAQVYTYSSSTGYTPSPTLFYGDEIDPSTGFLNYNTSYTPGSGCPICLSSNGQFLIMGGWMTMVAPLSNGTRSLLVARRPTSSSQFQYYTRLYTPNENNATNRLLGSDMVCASDLSTLYVAEQAVADPQSIPALVTVFRSNGSPSLPTWQSNETISIGYNNQSQSNIAARLGLSGNGLYLSVVAGSSTINIYDTSDLSLFQSINVTGVTSSQPVLTTALSYYADQLVYSTQGPIFIGQRYVHVIKYSNEDGQYDVSSDIILVDPAYTSIYSYSGTGTSLAFSPSASTDTLSVGMPGYIQATTPSPSSYPQTGALSIWQPCAITTPPYTRWQPGQTLLRQFTSGLYRAYSLGSSYTSHNVWSSDATILLGSAPMGDLTGRAWVFSMFAPGCPPPPSPVTPPVVVQPISPIKIATLVIIAITSAIGLGLVVYLMFFKKR